MRYKVDGSPYIFQDFEEDEALPEGYVDELDLSPKRTISQQNAMTDLGLSQMGDGMVRHESGFPKQTSFLNDLGDTLGIIKDEEEEDKESQFERIEIPNQDLIMSNETFHARSPQMKKNRNDHQLVNKAQGERELTHILKQRKMKKSVSLEEINRLSNDDCDLIITEDARDHRKNIQQDLE